MPPSHFLFNPKLKYNKGACAEGKLRMKRVVLRLETYGREEVVATTYGREEVGFFDSKKRETRIFLRISL